MKFRDREVPNPGSGIGRLGAQAQRSEVGALCGSFQWRLSISTKNDGVRLEKQDTRKACVGTSGTQKRGQTAWQEWPRGSTGGEPEDRTGHSRPLRVSITWLLYCDLMRSMLSELLCKLRWRSSSLTGQRSLGDLCLLVLEEVRGPDGGHDQISKQVSMRLGWVFPKKQTLFRSCI